MYSPEFQAGETKIVGQAFTVKFVRKSDEAAPKVQGNYVCDLDQINKDNNFDALLTQLED